MAFDGLFTHQIMKELQFLTTGRINKITQPDQYTVVMTIRAERKNQKLLLSAHPNFARIGITETTLENPFHPPMFLRVLRKHIEGGILTHLEQIGNDRIVKFTIRNTTEIGDPITRHIYIEMMGKHSNMVVTDADNKILECLKHLTPNTNSARTMMPGFTYELPPTEKKFNPYTLDTISEHINPELKLEKAILNALEGFSPLAIKHMLSLDTDLDKAFVSFMEQTNTVQAQSFQIIDQNKEDFYFMSLKGTENEKYFDSLSQLLDAFYKDRAHIEKIKNQTNDLSRHLNALNQKNQKKLIKLIQELEETKQKDQFNLYGELLTSHMYMMHQGMSDIEVTNYYNNEQVVIPLDKRKTPSENAQYYYKQYNKLKTRKVHAEQQINETKAEIEYIEGILNQLQYIKTDDIDAIRNELAEQKLIKPKYKTQNKKPSKDLNIDYYLSRDNETIAVGRNNLQNEYVTHKLARKDYIWFHAKDMPGSHVVIMHDDPTQGTIEDAAIIASYFSKAQEGAKTEVDFTEIKNVHKPSGSKPGFVNYFEQQTVNVIPDAAYVQSLREKYLNQ
ncbi:NFACT family protein [Macrococcus sp. DPC7161]|uniref:Rqc2 family fibronectin-binding protein n=1 Tax=Macrococcus sp. DPC7161 TaxID=2507060 RepID=UPI00100BF55D|nr:NFACT RNA binding domain-containing protein [Macrococcus sp. DPC7161]RXK18921.1 fibronectin/fibrinogen-binding protein [Macrococcus sp. DPC7161]